MNSHHSSPLTLPTKHEMTKTNEKRWKNLTQTQTISLNKLIFDVSIFQHHLDPFCVLNVELNTATMLLKPATAVALGAIIVSITISLATNDNKSAK